MPPLRGRTDVLALSPPHRSQRLLAAVLASIVLLGPFVAVADAGALGGAARSDETVDVVVMFHDTPDPDVVRRHGGEVNEVSELVPAVVATVPVSALGPLERSDDVAYVERDKRVQLKGQSAAPDAPPRDASEDSQTVPWGISRVGADVAHTRGVTGDGVVVAVLDTGIDTDHPELEESYAGGVNIVNNSSVPEDDHGHGTHVAGTIAAADDDQGVVGVAPGVSLYGVKVLNETGSGSFSDIIAGIEWAIAGPDGIVGTGDEADIISMSLGGYVGSKTVREAVETAYRDHDILVVGGSGDAGRLEGYNDTVMYPARYEGVIAVGAVNSADEVPNWSGYGPTLELVAPGVDVESTVPGGTVPGCGTSMATPHVTGVAALMYESEVPAEADDDDDGEWDADEVRARLHDTAIDIGSDGHDEKTGFGRVWAPAAIGPTADSGDTSARLTSPDTDHTFEEFVSIRTTERDSDAVDARNPAIDAGDGPAEMVSTIDAQSRSRER